ncbi:MAG: dockerin type I domain-containing protein [Chthoniobacterales bacterium]
MHPLKHRFTVLAFVALFLVAGSTWGAVHVTQHHNNDSRDGLYVDPAFTHANAAGLTRDQNFLGTIAGNVYAQPLYVEGGPNGPLVIAVTESNNVYALNATTGAIVWQRNVGTPITSGLPCGNINPLGITSTPVLDVASRALFLNAETTPSSGVFRHMVYSLNVDTGAINSGWPVDVQAAVSGFDSSVQSQRSALGLAGGKLYVPYGGRFGDCGSYRGRLVGIDIFNPASVTSWATTVTRAGVWAPGGVASDGTNLYVTTGNGNTSGTWGGAEAVIRLQPGPVFSGTTTDYWAPTNWMSLDSSDSDLGGSGPILVDVPGATPSALVVALGKDRNAYLLNRTTLGGVTAPLAQANVSSGTIIGAGTAYRTSTGTFVALRPTSGTLTAFRITATSPPAIATGWSVSSSGRTAPFITSTGGTNNVIVWAAGSDGRLRGYNGETGVAIFSGGGTTDVMAGVRSFNTGIAARGRFYYAADNKVYAFQMPNVAPTASSAVSRKTHGDAGSFDIPLPLTGTPGVECRSGGGTNDYSIVLTFSSPVTVTGDTQAQASAGDVGSAGASNGGVVTVKGNSVTIPLTNVPNLQTTNVTLFGVTDGVGYGNVVVPLSRVLGDVTGNGAVSATDVAATKANAGQTADAANFRSDVNASGTINSSDLGIVKLNTGTGLP